MPTQVTIAVCCLAVLLALVFYSSSSRPAAGADATPAASGAGAPGEAASHSAAVGIGSAAATAPAGGTWKLVWADEFNYEGLPDANKWGYEVGFIRNHESQYYTRSRPENARVEGGHLVIEGRHEKYTDPNAAGRNAGKPAEYTAASVLTRQKADWKYGRIEVRAKLPQGKGVWPAIWMLGSNIGEVGWPACGEIDIMEFVGKDPNHIHGTVHFRKDGKHKSSGSKLEVDKPWEDFHVYAVEWSPEKIDFYFDQTKYHTFPLSGADANGGNCFQRPHYLLINLALGGDWGGKIDDAIFPQKYLIDYVRVYEKK